MTSYTYVNGCHSVTTQIRNGWHRLNKCNAQVAHGVITYNDLTCNDTGSLEYWHFMSYATPICTVTKRNIGVAGKYSWRVYLSHDWNCSVSTQRQLSKFFKMFDLPCNNYWCKEADNLFYTHAMQCFNFTCNDINLNIVFCTNEQMEALQNNMF